MRSIENPTVNSECENLQMKRLNFFKSSKRKGEAKKAAASEPPPPTLIGLPLQSLPLGTNGVPSFVPPICSQIISEAATVGIFRLCGNHLNVQELGVVLNFPNAAVPPGHSVHDVSGFLKLWLRSLPVPLLDPVVVSTHYVADQPQTVRQALKHLEPVPRKTAAYIFRAIQAVIDQSAVNQMSFANLAVCFLSSLLQNGKGLGAGFRFQEFFQESVALLNESGDDFNL
jgi:hypothetical protein